MGILKGLIELFTQPGKALISRKSDCQIEFLQFDSNLTVPQYKLKKLKRARRTVQRKLKEYFATHPAFTIPGFATQGSFVTGTIIRNEQDLCDFDVGVYFFAKPPYKYETIQRHIKKALNGHTSAGIKLKTKCIRLNYQGDFHIDMPIYYTPDRKQFFLGSKGKDWEVCDSKKFKDWVKENTSNTPQAIRLVRYFKAWADFFKSSRRGTMPSGLVFTIWSIRCYEPHERDDVAFIYTAVKILKYLKDHFQSSWSCEMPVEPKDNVLDKLNKAQQKSFYNALKELVKTGTKAMRSENKEEAKVIWRKVFGRRFPD